MTDQATNASDPAGMGMATAGDGKMWLDHRYRQRLAEAGLADFQAVMESRGGRCLRGLEDRENWHFGLRPGKVLPAACT